MGSKELTGAIGASGAARRADTDPTQGLWFSIEIGKDEFIAFISAAALQTHFGAAGGGTRQLLAAYRRHQQTIDAAAHRKFLGGAFRPIQLCVADFPLM